MIIISMKDLFSCQTHLIFLLLYAFYSSLNDYMNIIIYYYSRSFYFWTSRRKREREREKLKTFVISQRNLFVCRVSTQIWRFDRKIPFVQIIQDNNAQDDPFVEEFIDYFMTSLEENSLPTANHAALITAHLRWLSNQFITFSIREKNSGVLLSTLERFIINKACMCYKSFFLSF